MIRLAQAAPVPDSGSPTEQAPAAADQRQVDLQVGPRQRRSIRVVMLSTGVLTKVVTLGKSTVTITQEGPIAYLETTTAAEVFDEDATRMLPLVTDESSEQTKRIHEHAARKAAGATTSEEAVEFVKAKHNAAQRMLDALPVVVPYAEHLQVPVQLLVARRAFEHLLGCIQAVALLRQRQNTKDEQGRVVASLEDYRIAYDLMPPILERFFGHVNERSLDLLKIVVQRRPQGTFRITDCLNWDVGLSRTAIKNRLNELVDNGFLEIVGGRRAGRTSTYKVLVADAGSLHDAVDLITLDELDVVLAEVQDRDGWSDSSVEVATGTGNVTADVSSAAEYELVATS